MNGWLTALIRCLGIALLLAALCAGAAARAEEPESGAARVAAAATDSLRYYNAGQLDAVVARLVPVLRDRTIDRRDRFSAAYLLSRLIERSGRSELLATLNDILIAMDQEGGERFGPNGPLIAHNVAQYYLSAGRFEEAYKASSRWLGLKSPLAEDPDMAGLYLALSADTAKALAALRRWENAAFVLERGMASLAMNGRASPADVFAYFEAVGVERMTAGLAHDARQVFAGLHRVAERTLPPTSPDRIRIALWLGSVLADTGEAARSTEMLNGVVSAGRANPSLPRHRRDLAALTIAFNQVGQGALDDAEHTLVALAETDVALYRTLTEMLGAEIELLRGGRPAPQRPAPPRDTALPAIGPAPDAYADYLAALAEAQAGRPTEAMRRIDNMLANLAEQDVTHANAGSTHIVPPTVVERRMLERSLRMILGADAGAAKLDDERARLAFDIVQRLGRQRAALGVGAASSRTMEMSALDREQLRAWELLNQRRRALIDHYAARIGDREHGRPVMDLSEEVRWRGIAELALYHDKLRKIRASLDSRMPGYLAATRAPHVGLDAFRAALNGDEAAVFLVPYGDGVLGACVGRGGIWLAQGTTPTAEIVAAIERLRQDLTAARAPGSDADSGYDMATAHSLYRTLFGGLEPCFETATHVIQVPAADFLLLPTAALTTVPHDGPLSAAPWFVRSHAISLLPSAASLTLLRATRPASQTREAFLGFGDPAPGTTDKPGRVLDMTTLYAMRGRADLGEPRELGRLPETAEELRALGRRLGAPADRIKLGADATEGALHRETLSDFRILAFATQSLLAREIDDLSEPAIVLTHGRQETRLDDGLLTATDIAELGLDADLVILSASNTTGRDGRGDARGLTGLANAFFGAGARSLIANQWPVDSAATRDMMIEAVTGAVRPASPGIAHSLREEALKMIGARDRPDLAHPRFWAPFIVAGDGRALAGKPRAALAPRGVRLVREWEIVDGGPRFDEAMRLEVASDGALLVTGVEGLSTESRRAATFHWRVSPEGRILSRRTVSDLGFAASSIRLPDGDSIRMGTTHMPASMTDAVVYREAPDGTRRWSVTEQSSLHETPGELVRTPRGTILAIMTRNTVAEVEAGSQAVVILELDEDGKLLRRQEIALPLCTVSDPDCTHRATPLGDGPTAAFIAGAFYRGDGRLRLVLRVEGRQPPNAGDGRAIDPISGHRPQCGLAVRTAIWELGEDLAAVRNATLHENLWPNTMATSPGGAVWLAGARYAPCEDDGDVFAAPVADSGALGGAIADGTALDEAATSVALSPRNEVLIAGRATMPLQIAQRAADATASGDPGAERAESVGGDGAALLLLYDGRARLAASLAVPNRRFVRIRDVQFTGDDRFAVVGTIDGGQIWIAAYRIERPAAP